MPGVVDRLDGAYSKKKMAWVLDYLILGATD